MTVPAAIYFGTGRGSRRRITRELGRLRELRDEMAPVRERIRERIAQVNALPAGSTERRAAAAALEVEFGAMLGLLRPPRVPLALLACRECGRPTAECTCGLDWGGSNDH